MTVVLFLMTAVFPRTAVVVHHHAGGDHEHVHAWGAEPEHPHPRRATDAVALEEPDDGDPDHVHVQAPYQPATRPPISVLFQRTIVEWLITRLSLPAGWIPSVPRPARAPPLPRVR